MYYAGVDIGGTKCAIVLGDNNLNVIKKVKFPTKSFEETFSRIVSELENIGDFDAIGISCGGPLNSEKGIILRPPNLPDWKNVEIVKILTEKFGVPVSLKNDADACALAEWKYGAGKGCNNMVFLTFGTGMGAGLIIDGKLYSGTSDTAGEIGHIRLADDGPVGFGKAGSFEGFCSGGGIGRTGQALAKEKTVNFYDNDGNITAKSIAEAASKGDKDAIDIYKNCGKMLGKGLSVIIDALNPEKIVIGSVYQRSGALMAGEMIKELEKESIKESLSVCQVVPAELGDDIGDKAALCVAELGKNKDCLFTRFPALTKCFDDIENAKDAIINAYENGGKILVCGNGGSASDSEHIVGELMKGFMSKRPVTDERIPKELRTKLQGALPAISLPSQTGLLSAYCNDVDPSMMYAQLVYGYIKEQDIFIGLTTSGNSENVVNAALVAKSLGAKVIALTGASGGKIKDIADITIKVPENETYKVQEYHLPVYHYLCQQAEKHFFKD